MIEKIKIRAGSGIIEGDLTVGGTIYNPSGNPLEIASDQEIDSLFNDDDPDSSSENEPQEIGEEEI